MRISDTALTLMSLYIPSLMLSFGQGMLIPTIPAIAKEFEVAPGFVAQVVTAQLLGGLAAMLPVGYLIDRFGRRPALLVGPVLIFLGGVATALSPSFLGLLAARFVTGVGSSAWSTAREIAAVDLIGPERRGRMMSGFFGMTEAGNAMGPVLGGILTDNAGFRAVFWGYAVVAVLIFLISLTIRETSETRGRGQRTGLVGLSVVEPEYRETFVILMINTASAMMRMTLMSSMLPLLVVSQRGLSTAELGTLFSISAVMNILMIAPTGFISDKIGRKAAVVPSGLFSALGCCGFAFADSMPLFIISTVLVGIASGLALGAMTTFTYDVAPAHARGQLQAVRRLGGQVGSFGGPLIGGILANAASPAAAFFCFVPFQLFAGLVMLVRGREKYRRPGAAAETS